MSFRGLTLGIPKEILAGERRVATTPEFVRKMVSEGATVVVEMGQAILHSFLYSCSMGDWRKTNENRNGQRSKAT